jgi:hypothetical protein
MTDAGPLHELLTHLRSLQTKDAVPAGNWLNVPLVERSRIALAKPELRADQVVELAQLTLSLLESLPEDLEPLVRLLLDAVELVTFDDLLRSIPVEAVVRGLQSPLGSVQLLGLAYLEKAAGSPSGAAFVANHDALVEALIRVFLTSTSAEIGGTKALEALISLLSVDDPAHVITLSDGGVSGQTTGQGLFWRRVFKDEGIYKLLFELTSSDSPSPSGSQNGDRSCTEITTAQGRLLDFVLAVAKIRWDTVYDSTRTDQPVLSNTKGIIDPTDRSLLRYATLEMIDQNDALMANVLVDFLTKLLELKEPSGCSGLASIPAMSSPSLEFLVQSDLHQRGVDYYVRSEKVDAADLRLLGGAQIRYLCTYADLYPEHFVLDTDLVRHTLNRLNRNLQMSGARWAHSSSPVHDLSVLGSLPSLALVRASTSNENPLMLLPTNPANADAYRTMAKIFGGPRHPDSGVERIIANHDASSRPSRAASARLLFYQYRDRHPEFWINVGATMNVMAVPDAVAASIDLVRSILSSVWASLPVAVDSGIGTKPFPSRSSSSSSSLKSSSSPSFPSEKSLQELCGGRVSDTGLGEILNCGESVIQSLLTPIEIVGGDMEVARLAWRLGREKFELVVLISDLMKERIGRSEVPDDVWKDVGGRIRERIRLDKAGGLSTTHTNLVGTMGR